jgi:hypothetical protein
VVGKASPKRYPAEPFKSPEPLRKTRICAISNQLATSACDYAGKSYTIDLPISMIPNDPCSVHGGLAEDSSPLQPGQPPNPGEPRANPTPPASGDRFDQRVIRSLRRFFGGR